MAQVLDELFGRAVHLGDGAHLDVILPARDRVRMGFDPNEKRDDSGKWTAPDVESLADDPGADRRAVESLFDAAPSAAARDYLETAHHNMWRDHRDAEPVHRRRNTADRLAAVWRDAHEAGDAESADHLAGVLAGFGAHPHGPGAGATVPFDGRYHESDHPVFTGDAATVVRPPVVLEEPTGHYVAVKGRVAKAGPVRLGFDPSEKRDEKGEWTAGGSAAASEEKKAPTEPRTITRLPETEDEALALATAARDAIIGEDEGDCAADGDCERASWLLRAVHPGVEIWHGNYNGEFGHNIVKAGDWFIDVTADQFGGEPIRVWNASEQEKGVLSDYPEYTGFQRYESTERYADRLGLRATAIVEEMKKYKHGPAML